MTNKISNIIKSIALTGTCTILNTQRTVGRNEYDNGSLILSIKESQVVTSNFNSMITTIPAIRYTGEWKYESIGAPKELTCSKDPRDLRELQNTWVSLPSLLKELGVNSPMFDSEFPTKGLSELIVKHCKMRVELKHTQPSGFLLSLGNLKKRHVCGTNLTA